MQKKTPTSLDDAVTALDKLYPDLYDINLYVHKADAGLSVIEIRYYLRSTLDADYQEKSTSTETMLHVKVLIPPYASSPRKKFDIHWESGTMNHRWKWSGGDGRSYVCHGSDS